MRSVERRVRNGIREMDFDKLLCVYVSIYVCVCALVIRISQRFSVFAICMLMCVVLHSSIMYYVIWIRDHSECNQFSIGSFYQIHKCTIERMNVSKRIIKWIFLRYTKQKGRLDRFVFVFFDFSFSLGICVSIDCKTFCAIVCVYIWIQHESIQCIKTL